MRFVCAILALCIVAVDSEAGCRGGGRFFGGGRRGGGSCGGGGCSTQACAPQQHYHVQPMAPANCPCGPSCPCPTGPNCPAGVCPLPAPMKKEGVKETNALDEVNAVRAARGLPPFIHDPNLEIAAVRCATTRAEHLIDGHLANDFVAVPAGTVATASGCAAWPPSMGWGACCTYDNYRYAGAAIRFGRDGRRFMHLFVR